MLMDKFIRMQTDAPRKVGDRRMTPSLRAAFMDRAVAHIAIDLQNTYCDPVRYPLSSLDTRPLAPQLSSFAQAMRAQGLRNVWVAHNSQWDENFSVRRELFDIDPAPEDTLIEKKYYDAFEDTALDRQLKKDGIRTVLLTGVFFEECVKATATGAARLGYDVYVIDDLTAKGDPTGERGKLNHAKNWLEYIGARLISEKNMRTLIDRACAAQPSP